SPLWGTRHGCRAPGVRTRHAPFASSRRPSETKIGTREGGVRPKNSAYHTSSKLRRRDRDDASAQVELARGASRCQPKESRPCPIRTRTYEGTPGAPVGSCCSH